MKSHLNSLMLGKTLLMLVSEVCHSFGRNASHMSVFLLKGSIGMY